ncbi:MAG: imidazolonepropionase [Fimbriimonadaceae bacterium]|nr:imidazolonepropionase [Fimbriimonadaceae bacterium]
MSILFRNVNLATMDGLGLAERSDACLGVKDGLIDFIGHEPPSGAIYEREEDCEGLWMTPGLVDCHTHLVWAGSRDDEFEARLHGKSYAEIAQEGGGILRTVAATRDASYDELVDSAVERAFQFVAEGVTTLDVKSGYGQDLDTELRMLRAARAVADEWPVRVVTGYLGLHVKPPEFENSDAYVEYVIHQVLPAVAREGLADYADAFCEGIAFTPEQTLRYFDAARSLGLPVRLHADQLTGCGGGTVAAGCRALSADHVEYTSSTCVRAMADAETTAVLLPGAYYFLREEKRPPVTEFREAGVPMAVATDCNPGSSPLYSLLAAGNMACVLFGLTPAEALRGMTVNAARAVGLSASVGMLRPGMCADLALWRVNHPRELVAQLGGATIAGSWFGGTAVE